MTMPHNRRRDHEPNACSARRTTTSSSASAWRGLLERSGFEVVGQAGAAGELIELVLEHRPELAIVGIRMPPSHTSEGLDASRAIRKELPETAILVLAAYVQVEQATDLLASGERVAIC